MGSITNLNTLASTPTSPQPLTPDYQNNPGLIRSLLQGGSPSPAYVLQLSPLALQASTLQNNPGIVQSLLGSDATTSGDPTAELVSMAEGATLLQNNPALAQTLALGSAPATPNATAQTDASAAASDSTQGTMAPVDVLALVTPTTDGSTLPDSTGSNVNTFA